MSALLQVVERLEDNVMLVEDYLARESGGENALEVGAPSGRGRSALAPRGRASASGPSGRASSSTSRGWSLDAVWAQSGAAVLVYVPHTTAGVTINEHADPAVARDFESALERIVPSDWSWQHVEEGEENAPTHIRAAFMGPSVLIPLRDDGTLALGTWQGDLLLRVRRAARAVGLRHRARLSAGTLRRRGGRRATTPIDRRDARRAIAGAADVPHGASPGAAGRRPRSGRTATASGAARAASTSAASELTRYAATAAAAVQPDRERRVARGGAEHEGDARRRRARARPPPSVAAARSPGRDVHVRRQRPRPRAPSQRTSAEHARPRSPSPRASRARRRCRVTGCESRRSSVPRSSSPAIAPAPFADRRDEEEERHHEREQLAAEVARARDVVEGAAERDERLERLGVLLHQPVQVGVVADASDRRRSSSRRARRGRGSTTARLRRRSRERLEKTLRSTGGLPR